MLALDGTGPAGWVRTRQDGCAKPMIGDWIGSRSDDLQPRKYFLKRQESSRTNWGRGRQLTAERVEFCTLVKRQGRNDKTRQVGIKTLRLRLYEMRRAQGHGSHGACCGQRKRSVMSGA